jgi:hypothetical protein
MAHDLGAEIIRRAGVPAGTSNVVRLSQPPTVQEQMQLMAARLERRPIVIMPRKCASVEEWMARYAGDRGMDRSGPTSAWGV